MGKGGIRFIIIISGRPNWAFGYTTQIKIKIQIKVNYHHRLAQLGVWLHNEIKMKMQVKVNHQQSTQLNVW